MSLLFKGTLEIDGKKINVHDVDAIDKGVDTYFKGKAAEAVPQGAKGGTLKLSNENHGELVIKNCLIEKGGAEFEGYGQE